MKKIQYDRTIQDLDGQEWGDSELSSHVVTECHRLRKVPLRDLTAENVRLLLGQGVGTEFLVPLALEFIQENPWVQGDFYAGDLILQLLDIPDYWSDHPTHLHELDCAISEMREQSERFKSEIEPAWQKLYS